MFWKVQISKENLPIKRFGYLISAIIMIIAVIAYINKWPSTPLWALITFYLLTGSLWVPVLIKPLYNLIGPLQKYFIFDDENEKEKGDDFFNKN